MLNITSEWALDDIEAKYGTDNESDLSWFEEAFMSEVCDKLFAKYGIFSDPSTQQGGRVGADFMSKDEGGDKFETKWEINDERDIICEYAINEKDSFDEAVDEAVSIMHDYFENNKEFNQDYLFDDEDDWYHEDDYDDEEDK